MSNQVSLFHGSVSHFQMLLAALHSGCSPLMELVKHWVYPLNQLLSLPQLPIEERGQTVILLHKDS